MYSLIFVFEYVTRIFSKKNVYTKTLTGNYPLVSVMVVSIIVTVYLGYTVTILTTITPLVHSAIYLQQDIINTDRWYSDQFGWSVGVAGDLLCAGAPYADDSAGTGYVFEYNKIYHNWTQIARIKASNYDDFDYFGYSCDTDGTNIIFGAYGAPAVYLYEPNTTNNTDNTIINFVEVSILTPNNINNNYYGRAVSIDKEFAVIGDYGYDGTAGDNEGIAYVIQRNKQTNGNLAGWGNWSQIQELFPSDRTEDGNFGASVSISNNLIIIGMNNADNGEGAAYIYEKEFNVSDNSDVIFKLIVRLKANDPSTIAIFGNSVSIDGYNNRTIIGARGWGSGNYGKCYFFEKHNNDQSGSNGNWSQVGGFSPNELDSYDYFGKKVVIYGNYAVSSTESFENGKGGAWVYKRDEIFGNWSELAYIEQPISQRSNYDYFGHSISISDKFIIVGSRGQDYDGVDASLSLKRLLLNLSVVVL